MTKKGEIAASIRHELYERNEKMAEFFDRHKGQYTKMITAVSKASNHGDQKGSTELYKTIKDKVMSDFSNKLQAENEYLRKHKEKEEQVEVEKYRKDITNAVTKAFSEKDPKIKQYFTQHTDKYKNDIIEAAKIRAEEVHAHKNVLIFGRTYTTMINLGDKIEKDYKKSQGKK